MRERARDRCETCDQTGLPRVLFFLGPFFFLASQPGEAAECAYFTAVGGRVHAYEAATASLLRSFRVGQSSPTEIAIAGGKAYVTTPLTSDVRVLDLRSGQEVRAINVGAMPRRIRSGADQRKVYVIIFLEIIIDPPPDPPPPPGSEYALRVISVESDTVIQNVSDLGLYPTDIVVGEPPHLYVASLGDELTDVSTITDQIVDRLPAPPSSAGVASGGYLYLGGAAAMYRYDWEDRQVDLTSEVGGAVQDVAITPDGSAILAALRDSAGFATLALIEPTSLAESQTWELGFLEVGLAQVEFAEGGSRAFVAVPGVGAFLLDLGSGQLLPIGIEDAPLGVGVGECPPAMPTLTASCTPPVTPTVTPTVTSTATPSPPATGTPTVTATIVQPTATITSTPTPNVSTKSPTAPGSATATVPQRPSDNGGCSMTDSFQPPWSALFALVLLLPLRLRRCGVTMGLILGSGSVVKLVEKRERRHFATRGSFGNSSYDLWGLYVTKTRHAWQTTLGDNSVVAIVDTRL